MDKEITEEFKKSFELIEYLRRLKNPVFSLNDISKITGYDLRYTKVFLSRIVKTGLLVRVEKNKYVVRDTNPLLVASNLIFPSYISFISALGYHNLTLQIPHIIYVVCLRKKKQISYNGYTIKFVRFNRKSFFGYRRELLDGKYLFIGEVEKVILDCLKLPKYCPISEVFYAIKNAKLDMDKLIRYAKKMSSEAVIKRLGYLLEIAGFDASKLKISFKNYSLLNPLLHSKGPKNKKWKIIVNEVVE